MKKSRMVLAIGLLNASFGALAFDFTPSADRIISDPNFLPSAGEIYGATAYTFAQKNTGSVRNYQGNKAYSFDESSQIIDQAFEYGIVDDLTVSISQSYVPLRTASYSSSQPTLHDKGLTNPIFGATYRILDQAQNPLTVDLTAHYSPDIIDAKDAAPGKDGSVALGGQRSSLSMGLGYETRSFTLRGTVQGDYYSGRDVSNRGSDAVLHVGSFWNKYFEIQTQTRFTETFSANINIVYTAYDDREVSYTNYNFPKYKLSNDNSYLANLQLNYQFIPNRLVGQLEYHYEWAGDSHRRFDNPQFIYGTPTTYNQDIHGVTLRLMYRI